MIKVEPTHNEIMNSLSCGWFRSYNKGNCQCHDRDAFKSCYNSAKARLTKTVYTEEEIAQAKEASAKAMADLEKAMDECFG